MIVVVIMLRFYYPDIVTHQNSVNNSNLVGPCVLIGNKQVSYLYTCITQVLYDCVLPAVGCSQHLEAKTCADVIDTCNPCFLKVITHAQFHKRIHLIY